MPVAFHARIAVSKIHSLDNVPGARGHVPKIDSFAQAGSLDDFVRQILLDALELDENSECVSKQMSGQLKRRRCQKRSEHQRIVH